MRLTVAVALGITLGVYGTLTVIRHGPAVLWALWTTDVKGDGVSDIREVAAAHADLNPVRSADEEFVCEECSESFVSPRAATLCGDRDRREDRENRRGFQRSNN